MRILHVVHQYLPEYVGGTELYTKMAANYQHRTLGHQVGIFYPSDMAPSGHNILVAEDDGVGTYAVPLGPRSRREVFFSLFRQPLAEDAFTTVLEEAKPNLVHFQHLMGLPLPIVRQVTAATIPFVVTLHDYWFPCANGQLLTNYDETVCAGPRLWVNCGRCALARAGVGDQPLLAPALAPLLAYRFYQLRSILAEAAAIIAPNQFVLNVYRELAMPMERAVVIPHGIEVPPHVLVADSASRRSRGQPLHIVYVGSLARQKGVHVLIEAVNRLPVGAVRLTLFGDLDKFPDYVQSLREQAQHPGITFAGRVERDTLWSFLLSEAGVAVLPTLWYEASPLSIQEMFAAGVPIIASRIGALPEMIRHDVDGLLVSPGDVSALVDALLRLLNEDDLLSRLRASIQPTRLTDQHMVEIMALYERVIAEQ